MNKNAYRSEKQYTGGNMSYSNKSTAMSIEEKIIEEESKKKIKELYKERIKNLKSAQPK